MLGEERDGWSPQSFPCPPCPVEPIECHPCFGDSRKPGECVTTETFLDGCIILKGNVIKNTITNLIKISILN